MFNMRQDFNCCKTVSCKNFGINKSDDYIYKSKRLGYLAIECKACGSLPPWVNNQIIENILKEKLAFHFARKISHCTQCYPYFFFNKINEAQLHGFTAAGTQRLKCKNCQHIYSLGKHKNIEAIQQVLQTVEDKLDISLAIKKTGLPARLYYFYLDKLSLLLTNYSRLKEQQVMQRNYIALQTEGKVIHLEHQRGFYALLTAESNSGYILLQTSNLTQQKLTKQDIYDSTENTIIKNAHSINIENEINQRYQQTMQRKHFEKLLVGELKPINRCHLINPARLSYVHFLMLRAFTLNTERYGHYIEHESSIRAAALMSASPEIKTKQADIYYYLPFTNTKDTLINKKAGWWGDRWSSFELGAYCSITESLKNINPFNLNDTEHLNRYYSYLNKQLNKGLNSLNSIANFTEIHRALFNFCEVHNGKTPAMRFALSQQAYSAQALLQEAIIFNQALPAKKTKGKRQDKTPDRS